MILQESSFHSLNDFSDSNHSYSHCTRQISLGMMNVITFMHASAHQLITNVDLYLFLPRKQENL